MRRRHRHRWAILLSLVTFAGAPASWAQDRVIRNVVKETSLTSVPYEAVDGRVFLSASGQSAAYVARREAGEYVWHDGVLTGPYDQVSPLSITFSPDGKRLAFAARCGRARVSGDPPKEDGMAWHDDSWHIVVDGKPGPLGYERVAEETLRFTPDGKAFAFAARRDGHAYAVCNNVESAGVDAVRADGFDLLPDGRLVYVAQNVDGEHQVIGNEAGPAMASVGRAKFSFDGLHIAYAATPAAGGEDVVLLDGAIAAHATAIDPRSVTFAPVVGGPIAYVSGDAGKRLVHFIGAPEPKGKAFDRIPGDSITFSPDAQHLAYVGWRDGMAFVVNDGTESVPYYGVKPQSLRFSPDGKRLAYVAEGLTYGGASSDVGHASAVVIDGREGKPYAFIRTAPTFTPDGRHVSYVAQRSRTAANATPEQFECVVVVDGVEGQAYPWIRSAPIFDHAGNHFAYIATGGDDRFADAEELPRLLDEGASRSGMLVIDKSLATRAEERLAPHPSAKPGADKGGPPLRILLVEEQLRQE